MVNRPTEEDAPQKDLSTGGEFLDEQIHRADPPALSTLTDTGSPQAESADDASGAEERRHDELYHRAAVLGINGRSRMTTDALAKAVEGHEADDDEDS